LHSRFAFFNKFEIDFFLAKISTRNFNANSKREKELMPIVEQSRKNWHLNNSTKLTSNLSINAPVNYNRYNLRTPCVHLSSQLYARKRANCSLKEENLLHTEFNLVVVQ